MMKNIELSRHEDVMVCYVMPRYEGSNDGGAGGE